MKEEDFARSVGRHLDAGLDALPPAVLHRLRAARDAALEQAHDNELTGSARPQPRAFASRHRLLAPMAVALVAVAALVFWQQGGQRPVPARHADFADVDTEVVTGDLPVVAYLDPGFEIWLYHHAPASAED
jgi:hypothetical protein